MVSFDEMTRGIESFVAEKANLTPEGVVPFSDAGLPIVVYPQYKPTPNEAQNLTDRVMSTESDLRISTQNSRGGLGESYIVNPDFLDGVRKAVQEKPDDASVQASIDEIRQAISEAYQVNIYQRKPSESSEK